MSEKNSDYGTLEGRIEETKAEMRLEGNDLQNQMISKYKKKYDDLKKEIAKFVYNYVKITNEDDHLKSLERISIDSYRDKTLEDFEQATDINTNECWTCHEGKLDKIFDDFTTGVIEEILEERYPYLVDIDNDKYGDVTMIAYDLFSTSLKEIEFEFKEKIYNLNVKDLYKLGEKIEKENRATI